VLVAFVQFVLEPSFILPHEGHETGAQRDTISTYPLERLCSCQTPKGLSDGELEEKQSFERAKQQSNFSFSLLLLLIVHLVHFLSAGVKQDQEKL